MASFYKVNEYKYLNDDYDLQFRIEKFDVAEDEKGNIAIALKKENFIEINVSLQEIINSKNELTIVDGDGIFKTNLPKFLLEGYDDDKFGKVVLYLSPVK
jgi:hypothetical protein